MPEVLWTLDTDPNARGGGAPRSLGAAVRYATGSGSEDIHLFYSGGREHGPEIIRDGFGPPRMALIDRPWETTTNAWLQRRGTWFISPESKEAFIRTKLPAATLPALEFAALRESLEATPDYLSHFRSLYEPDRRLVGLQSFGDLTMNNWNVAFVRSPRQDQPNHKDTPKLIYLGTEPINDRIYTCMVKWKRESRLPSRVTIESLRFSRFAYDSHPNAPGVVMLAESERPIADKIEFAVDGQLVVRNGAVVKPQEIVHQFSDIRHLLLLPNLNPAGPLYRSTTDVLDKDRPRYYFGYQRSDDVWFGESQLLSDRNLRRAALGGAVELGRLHAGASEDQVKAALAFRTIRAGANYQPEVLYTAGPNPPNPLNESQWRFVMEDRALLEVYLRPNIYPASILGVTEQGDVVCFAWRGNYSVPPGYTIVQGYEMVISDPSGTEKRVSVQSAAKVLLDTAPGITDAILLDEGNDVRHEAWDPKLGQYRRLVVDENNREQVRAVLLFSESNKGGA